MQRIFFRGIFYAIFVSFALASSSLTGIDASPVRSDRDRRANLAWDEQNRQTLRQIGVEESDDLRQKLLEALENPADPLKAVAQGVFRLFLPPIAPASSGMEELSKEEEEIVWDNVDKLLSSKFRDTLLMESIGGNAGEGYAAVNGVMDEQGRIVALGNIQDLPRDTQERIEGQGGSSPLYMFGVPVKVLSKMKGPSYKYYLSPFRVKVPEQAHRILAATIDRMNRLSTLVGVAADLGTVIERIQKMLSLPTPKGLADLMEVGERRFAREDGFPVLARVTMVTQEGKQKIAADSTSQQFSGRQIALEPGALTDNTRDAVKRLYGPIWDLNAATLETWVSRFKERQADLKERGIKDLVVVRAGSDLANRLKALLEKDDATWQWPVVILEIPEAALPDLDSDPDAFLVYLSELFQKADPIPQRRMERLEGVLTLEEQKKRFFLSTRA